MKYLFFFLITFSLLVSCDKQEPLITETPEVTEQIDTSFQLQWKSSLGGSNYSGRGLLVSNNLVISATDDLGDPNISNIIAFDKNTGQRIWSINVKDLENGYRGITRIDSKDDFLVIHTGTALIVLNLITKKVVWSEDFGDLKPTNPMTIIGDYAYVELTNNKNDHPSFRSKLVRCHIPTGQCEDVYEYVHPEQHNVFYSMPSCYIEPESQDSMLVFSRYYFHLEEGYDEIPSDLVVYNLSKRAVHLVESTGNPNRGTEYHPSIIVDGDVLMVKGSTLYRFDIMTGHKKWESKLNTKGSVVPFHGAMPHLHGNTLILQEFVAPLHSININNGTTNWINENGSYLAGDKMVVRDGSIVNASFSNRRLRAYDLATGITFVSWDAEDVYINGSNVVYDEETGFYYTQGTFSVIGFKITNPLL